MATIPNDHISYSYPQRKEVVHPINPKFEYGDIELYILN